MRRALGKRLASHFKWWDEAEDLEDDVQEKSFVRLRRAPAGEWTLRVVDAIGVIGIPGLQIVVEQKMPLDHLLLLFRKTDVWPRLDEQHTKIEQLIPAPTAAAQFIDGVVIGLQIARA